MSVIASSMPRCRCRSLPTTTSGATTIASTQLHLAAAIGYDKPRLIALLDESEAHGLVRR